MTPLRVGALAANAGTSGGAALKAEGDKRKKYAENGIHRRADNVKLFPLAFETFGRRGRAASAFFRMVATSARGEDLETCPKWAFYQHHARSQNQRDADAGELQQGVGGTTKNHG